MKKKIVNIKRKQFIKSIKLKHNPFREIDKEVYNVWN